MPSIEEFVGQKRVTEDFVDPRTVAQLAGLLGRSLDLPQMGEPIPLGWQCLFGVPRIGPHDHGEDGHPKRGLIFPPIELPRRMFASTKMMQHKPLCVGDALSCVMTIKDIQEKKGRSGDLIFVTVLEEFLVGDDLAIEEEKLLVYRGMANVSASQEKEELPPFDWKETWLPTRSMLFRFSALVNNTHRIHYDLPYAQDVEGYPNVIVHAQFTGLMMLEGLYAHAQKEVTSFAFKATSPFYAEAEAQIGGKQEAPGEVGFWAHDGSKVVLSATAGVAE